MNRLRSLLSCYPWQALALGLLAGLALAWLWSFTHYTPDNPALPGRGEIRAAQVSIGRNLAALATDTPLANIAHAEAHTLLDSARVHARRATRYHQQAAPPAPLRHAKKTATTSALPRTAEQLQRELTAY